MSLRSSAALLLVVVTLGCAGSGDATGPAQKTSPTSIVPASQTEFVVFPGEEVPSPLSVRLELSQGTAVAGSPVTFSLSDGTRVTVTTQQDGFAVLYRWPLDYSKSEDSIVATAPDVSGSVTFRTSILHKTTVATYDLQSAGGQEPPLTYQAGGVSFDITGAHYVLFTDGTYVSGYEVAGRTDWSRILPFIQRDTTIDFYLDAKAAEGSLFYGNNNYVYSTGTLSGSLMTMKYADASDYMPEVYRLEVDVPKK